MNLPDKNLYLLALPGFVALFSANFVSDMPQIRDSQLPFVYFILSVFSLLPPICMTYLVTFIRKKAVSFKQLLSNAYFLLGTFVFSIIIGFSFGVMHTTDIVSSTLRNIFGKDIVPIYSHNELVRELFSRAYSTKYTFPDGRFPPDGKNGILPTDKFDHASRYARFSFSKGGVAYEGIVNKFFSGTDKPQAYISPACMINGNEVEIVQGPGVWINLASASTIQFIDARCSLCATKHEELNGREGGKTCPYNID